MQYANQYYNNYIPNYYQPYNYSYQNQFSQPQQNVYSTMQTSLNQVQNNSQHHDFVGSFVKSYDEVRNINPDQTMVFLDKENDKIYIKRINEKGVPETSVFQLTEVETNLKTDKTAEENQLQMSLLDEKIKKATDQLINDFDIKLKNIEKKIKPVAIINKT